LALSLRCDDWADAGSSSQFQKVSTVGRCAGNWPGGDCRGAHLSRQPREAHRERAQPAPSPQLTAQRLRRRRSPVQIPISLSRAGESGLEFRVVEPAHMRVVDILAEKA
jgi:hypothetical protein